MIPVILVTGFLGSGKTTLLQHLVGRTAGRRIAWIVNEFSDIDVDGRRLQIAEGESIQIAGGSIFCRCKVADFTSALSKIADRADPPDAIIVEASGMADPRVLPRMLMETGFHDRLALHRVLAVVDPVTLPKLLPTLPAIAYQLQAADTVIINRCDLVDEDAVALAQAEVTRLAPGASTFTTSHCQVDIDPLQPATVPQCQGEYAGCRNPRFLPRGIDRLAAVDPACIRDRLQRHRAVVLRAKGLVDTPNGRIEVDWACGRWSTHPSTDPGPAHLAVILRGDAGAATADATASLDTLPRIPLGAPITEAGLAATGN